MRFIHFINSYNSLYINLTDQREIKPVPDVYTSLLRFISPWNLCTTARRVCLKTSPVTAGSRGNLVTLQIRQSFEEPSPCLSPLPLYLLPEVTIVHRTWYSLCTAASHPRLFFSNSQTSCNFLSSQNDTFDMIR